jgi:hypothetical protein
LDGQLIKKKHLKSSQKATLLKDIFLIPGIYTAEIGDIFIAFRKLLKNNI